jgi:hypothetical protein
VELGALSQKCGFVTELARIGWLRKPNGGDMQESNGIFDLETHSGEPVTVGDIRLTPQSQALTIRWPTIRWPFGGFVWNRPVAVLVEEGDESERIPIVDVTLVAQVALLALGAAFALTTLILSATIRRK